MGQTGSTEEPEYTYVPVYKRPKWPNNDWYVALELRPLGVIGREVGYTKHEFVQFSKNLKEQSLNGELEPYVRQRLHDLVTSLKTSKNEYNNSQGNSHKTGRLQRTFSNLRSFRLSRSPDPRVGQRSRANQHVTRKRSHDCAPRSPLLTKDTSQHSTIHEFDLTEVTNPLPVEEIPLPSVCEDVLTGLVERLRISTDSGNGKDICGEVYKTMEDTQWFLRRTFKAFKDVEIISAGSIADGTKIVSADEFDYVILLPSLEHSVKDIAVLEDTQNEYIRLQLAYHQEKIEHGDQFSDVVNGESGQHLMHTVLETLKSFLRPSWAFISTESKSFVTRIHLVRKTSLGQQDIRFDVSLALPISCNKVVPVAANDPEDVIKLPLWNRLVASLQKYEGKVFALIPSETSGRTRRISLALAEKEQLHCYGENSGVVKCLCFCKIIVALFLPLVLVNDSWEAYVPPYQLKNAVFFLIDHYRDKSKWEGKEVHSRVVEVFLLLGKSLWPEGFGSRGSRLSLFVFPGFTSFPEYCNDSCRFDPQTTEIKDEMTHSFHEGKMKFPCKFPLQNEMDSLLGIPEFSSVCKKYAERLRGTDWKFREIIVDLISLLKEAFSYQGPEPWISNEANNNSQSAQQ